MKHKLIGLIGGVGPQATRNIYDRIIYYAQNKYKAVNNNDYPHLIIESIPVPDFISNKGSISIAADMFKETLVRFKKCSVDAIAIGSNTVHIILPEFKKITEIQFISTIDLVIQKCILYGYNRIGLLASPLLIKQSLYQNELIKSGIDTVIPSLSEVEIIEKIIRGVIAGCIFDNEKKEYILTVEKLFKNGAEAVILGCTELPLVLDYKTMGMSVLNSDDILAEGIVDYYYKRNHI